MLLEMFFITIQYRGNGGGGRLVSPPERQKSHAIMHVDLTLHMGVGHHNETETNKPRVVTKMSGDTQSHI